MKPVEKEWRTVEGGEEVKKWSVGNRVECFFEIKEASTYCFVRLKDRVERVGDKQKGRSCGAMGKETELSM